MSGPAVILAPLLAELDRWGESGGRATFWLRDDDLTAPSPALDAFLETTTSAAWVPALAVVPGEADAHLPNRLAGESVRIFPHGWRHIDHEWRPAKKAEFGGGRPVDWALADAQAGLEALNNLFGLLAVTPVFVPPWNRVTPEVTAGLRALGFTGMSTFGPRAAARTEQGLGVTNTHVDLIDWHGTRSFIGEAATVDGLVAHLAARREGTVDLDEPTGLLSHHLDMPMDAWPAVGRILAAILAHPAAHVVDPADLVGNPPEGKQE